MYDLSHLTYAFDELRRLYDYDCLIYKWGYCQNMAFFCQIFEFRAFLIRLWKRVLCPRSKDCFTPVICIIIFFLFSRPPRTLLRRAKHLLPLATIFEMGFEKKNFQICELTICLCFICSCFFSIVLLLQFFFLNYLQKLWNRF